MLNDVWETAKMENPVSSNDSWYKRNMLESSTRSVGLGWCGGESCSLLTRHQITIRTVKHRRQKERESKE